MSDQLSKVVAEMREAVREGEPMKFRYLTQWADRLESATTPAEVGEYTHAQRESMIAAMRRDAAEYCLFGLDYLSSAAHDYATLARQLAEAKAAAERHERNDILQMQRAIKSESQLAEVTRRLGAWRNRFVSERTGTHQASGMTYELARAHAESDANEYAGGLEAALTKEPTK